MKKSMLDGPYMTGHDHDEPGCLGMILGFVGFATLFAIGCAGLWGIAWILNMAY